MTSCLLPEARLTHCASCWKVVCHHQDYQCSSNHRMYQQHDYYDVRLVPWPPCPASTALNGFTVQRSAGTNSVLFYPSQSSMGIRFLRNKLGKGLCDPREQKVVSTSFHRNSHAEEHRLVCGCANLLNLLGCQAELVLGLLHRFGHGDLLQVKKFLDSIAVSLFWKITVRRASLSRSFSLSVFFCNKQLLWHVFSINILQLDGKTRDNSWGVFEEEEAGKDSRKHLSLSLDSTFHHCCLEKERDVELLHRDLSTALLVQLVSQKGLLGMSQKDNVIEEENTGKINPEEAKTDNKRELEMRLGRVVWHLQASLKCNTHGVGERVVHEHEDGQAS